jgi:GMP synthase (glutamine-hydrolysing)
MRTNESQTVVKYLKKEAGIEEVILEDASEEFLAALNGVDDPEQKRKIVGDLFVRVQNRVRERLGFGADAMLCQGTLYTDLVESGKGAGAGAEQLIKTHHNVGSPEIMAKREQGGLIEPLGNFYKDESRKIGLLLGLSEELIYRQPYPGPGLAIRLVGQAVTKEKLDMLRKAEDIYAEEIKNAGLGRAVSQYFAAILNSKAVGVMGDGRTHQQICALRAVKTSDFMTADWYDIPHEVLRKISTRIVNEVKGINRVVYDISTKPPGTIEFE